MSPHRHRPRHERDSSSPSAAETADAARHPAGSRSGDQPASSSSENREAESTIALIDASNVAHSTEGERPRLANIRAVMDKVREEGLEPVVMADAALRHQIDDTRGYEALVDDGTVRQAPAGTDADYFILSFARELNAWIVSNDRFKDRIAQYPEARDRVIRYMIVESEVVLERRTKRRD